VLGVFGGWVKIEPGVVIGDDVRIGDDCVLHANAVVAYGCTLGNRVVLHHGAVIGSDGFGFASDPRTGCHVSKPQVGTVRLDDDVQIGANSCVDRAAFGVTHIKSGVRIDNQVMVGHNCVIGENSILVAQAGIAGSTTLGRNVILAARAAVGGHLRLDDGVMVAALGGVHNDQKKGAVVGGIPAIEIKKWGRAAAVYARLPEMAREVKHLRKELDRVTSELKPSAGTDAPEQ
ncbi:MAG: UDP-3-O-(3-hydroxymyristoyl)glucosamine N-acyltransferase, partial [Candidatus Electrothrix sp. AUS1_2]|nr:UDP-3-O-(3-hydroxymyristoyl)glucosamine N-acyltransferase [Candidatus Electrothrix sp. AUS1_2]